ncbi:NYN domain-containing protein [candidate division WOR-3 bacterium]|nr:NYN domain-containing protein [candidate division WOR-3 bacterium]
MAGPSYIIDGYNLLHKLPELAGLAGSDLELARELLLGRLVCWRGRRGIAVTVVFDGTGRAATAPRAAAGVRVVFSRPPRSADAEIAALLAGHRSPRSVMVVSSDREVRTRARDRGAKTVLSEEFAAGLRPAAAAPPDGEVKPEMRAEDVRDWERYFREGRTGQAEGGPRRRRR